MKNACCFSVISARLDKETPRGGHQARFELYPLKAKIKSVLTACTVAMVTYFALKTTIIGSPMAGGLCDANIVALLYKQW